MNEHTILYQLEETSKFMMSFVIITKEDNAIIIDGGRPGDMPRLKEYVGGRTVKAWILTHAHDDHISGFIDEIEKNGGADFNIEAVYHGIPPYADMEKLIDKSPHPKYFKCEIDEMIPAFEKIAPTLGDKLIRVTQGDTVTVDECEIKFIYSYHEDLITNPMNDASLVFFITTPDKKVLFLGDLGPEGGDVLLEENYGNLKADIVQMAHHGHMNVGMEVYAEIAPEACLWCCRDWLYDEIPIPTYLADRKWQRSIGRGRMYGTTVTRKWMDILGVKTHYVTKDGTNKIIL